MKNFVILFCLCTAILLLSLNDAHSQNNWPQWRGPTADGLLLNGNPPVEFGEDKNVKWKIDLPGSGNSTLIIWKNQLFILAAMPTDKTVQLEKKEAL